MKKMLRRKSLKYVVSLMFIVVLAVVWISTNAQDGFPEPQSNPDQLFYLQRTHNKNTIVYELNKKDGVLNTSEPIHVFWIRYEENGQRKELSYIQRKFAYGIHAKKINEEHYRLSLTSYGAFPMDLIKGPDNSFKVYANANGKRIRLRRIFIKITGGTMWSPNIEYFELKGTEVQSGDVVTERMKVLKGGTAQ